MTGCWRAPQGAGWEDVFMFPCVCIYLGECVNKLYLYMCFVCLKKELLSGIG